MMRRFFLLCLLSALPALTLGRVFKSVGPDGQVTFGDTPNRVERVDDLPDVTPVAPGLEGEPLHAALTVYYAETMVEFSYRFCRDKVPQQQKNVLEARNQWNNIHSALRQKKIAVLHDHYGADHLRSRPCKIQFQPSAD